MKAPRTSNRKWTEAVKPWKRALVSSLASIAAGGALAACDGPMRTSSSTNWLTCQVDADCAGFVGATCNDEEVCIDAAGDPIPANSTRDGLVSGVGGADAQGECGGPSSSTLCLGVGGEAGMGNGSEVAGGAGGGGANSTLAPNEGGSGNGEAGTDTGAAGTGGAPSLGGDGGTSPGGAGTAGTAGTTAGTCDCEPGQYCERSSCDENAPGQCAPMPELCAANFAPVCGCNGQTFSNACGAASVGINLDATGAGCEDAGVVLTLVVDSAFGPVALWYNGTSESIFLRGCSTVDAWYRDGAEWIEYGALANCAMETEVVEVNAGASYNEFLPEAPVRGDDVWRLTGPYGIGCTPGNVFSEAECATTSEVTSFNETAWSR